jgi:hypothetical protein
LGFASTYRDRRYETGELCATGSGPLAMVNDRPSVSPGRGGFTLTILERADAQAGETLARQQYEFCGMCTKKRAHCEKTGSPDDCWKAYQGCLAAAKLDPPTCARFKRNDSSAYRLEDANGSW